MRIETDGVRVRIRNVEEKPVYVAELEELLRGFLEQVERLVGLECDLRYVAAACEVRDIRERTSCVL